MATRILGISAFFHDSAAALVEDGRVVAAAQEERFTRKKGEPAFPAHAVSYCLQRGGLRPEDLDYVVFYEKPLVRLERLLETNLAFAPRGFASFRESMASWAGPKLQVAGILAESVGAGFRGEVCFADHHESHAASAFYPSPFEEAAILTNDAVGEWGSGSFGTGRGNRIELTNEMRFPHSLGMLYSAFTYYAGFKVNSGEYKLMGLAPYGEPSFVDRILGGMARIEDDGSLWLDMDYFNYCHGLTMTSDRFHDLFGGPPRKPESWITRKEMDLAASVQFVCEEVVMKTARRVHEITGMRNLTMAGGVALNCVANGRLLREGPFENVWVQPAAGDAGGALGSALLLWHQMLDRPRTTAVPDSQGGSLLGPEFDDDEIGLFLDSVGAVYRRFDDEPELLAAVAELLADEQVVGWFQGRMEFGPRSLGCRSILGDARSPQLQQTMNIKVKFRESFRPFAPSILKECVHEVVDMRVNEDSPYMLLVADVKEELRLPSNEDETDRDDMRLRVSVPRSKFPAITHVDYSARVQTVDPQRHGRFYRLLQAFRERTGSPTLINTSFNIRGEPIVCNPEDAYRCFMGTDMDCLVLENHLLIKEMQPQALLQEISDYRREFALD